LLVVDEADGAEAERLNGDVLRVLCANTVMRCDEDKRALAQAVLQASGMMKSVTA